MFDPKILDDISHRLSAVLPESLQAVQQDVENNFKTVLQNAFTKLDLVSREEFEIQAAVLGRTRQKLDAIEAQLAEMDAKLAGDAVSNKAGSNHTVSNDT